MEHYYDGRYAGIGRMRESAELKDYLLTRLDLYGDETEPAPIVMENGTVLFCAYKGS